MMFCMFVDAWQIQVVDTDDTWFVCCMGQKPNQQLLLEQNAIALTVMMLGAGLLGQRPKQLMLLRSFGTRAADADDAPWVCGMGKEQDS